MLEGYIYVKQKNLANGVVSYECEMRKRDTLTSNQCKAKVKVANDEVVGFVNEHTHAPVVGRPEALRVRVAIKERAVDTMETPQQILAQTEVPGHHPATTATCWTVRCNTSP